MKFEVIRNDITNMQVDAIVLPANPQLKEGSGVSKKVYDIAGRKDLEGACKKLGKQEVGNAVHTLGYALNAEFIIHAIVPNCNSKDDEAEQLQLLSETYFSVLELADEIGCKSLAIPLLGSGHRGFEIEDSYIIARESIGRFEPNNKLEKVILVVYNKEAMTIMRKYNENVVELIDEKYILMNNEQYEFVAKRVFKKSKTAAEKTLKDSVDKAKVHIENPENREKLIAGVVAAAKIVSDEKNREKILKGIGVAKKVAGSVAKILIK